MNIRLLLILVAVCFFVTGCSNTRSSALKSEQPQLPNTSLQRAVQLQKTGDLKAAESVYKDVLNQGTSSREAVLNLGLLYETSGRSPQALALYRNLLAQRPNDAELLFRIGNIYERNGDQRSALSWYEKAISVAPSDNRPVIQSAWILVRNGKESEARNFLRSKREQGLQSAPTLSLEADLLLSNGEHPLAQKLYATALQLDTHSFDALNGLGNIALERGDLAAARSYWKRAVSSTTAQTERDTSGLVANTKSGRSSFYERSIDIAIGPQPDFLIGQLRKAYSAATDGAYADCLRELGDSNADSAQSLRAFCLQGSGNSAGALALLLKKIAALDSPSSFDLSLAGLLLLREGDVAKAQDFLEQAVLHPSPTALSYSALADLHYERRDYAKALSALNQAIILAPENGRLFANRALIYDQMGNDAVALKSYQEAIQKLPVPEFARFNYGLILIRKGKFAEAASQFELYLSQQESDVEARNNLGYAFAMAGKPEAAEQQWQAVLRKNAIDPLALNNIGVLRARRGDHNEAARLYERAIAASGGNASEYYHNLAIAAVQLGQTEKAIDAYQQTLRLNASDIEAHHSLGSLLIKVGNPEEALKHLPVVVTARPGDPEPLFKLAVAYQLDGKTTQALEFYRQFLAIAEQLPEYYEETIQAQAEIRRLSSL
jgi:tetratricopeptide (TPR) repeat protein